MSDSVLAETEKSEMCCALRFLTAAILIPTSIASLSVKPLNTVTVSGVGTVTFGCQNTTNTSRWVWTSVDETSSCQIYDRFDYGACVTDMTKYYVTAHSTGFFNLTVFDANLQDAGTVFCEEFSEIAEAGVAVIGIAEPGPTITATPPSCTYEGDEISFRCELVCNGTTNVVPPSFSWSGVSGLMNDNVTQFTPSTALYWSTANVTAARTDISSATCSVRFSSATTSFIPPGAPATATNATNAPTYTSTSTPYRVITVRYCPEAISIVTSGGGDFTGGPVPNDTVVVCSVSGGSATGVNTSFQWTNASGHVISIQPSVVVPANCSYAFNCTASSTMYCIGVDSKLCPASLSKNDIRNHTTTTTTTATTTITATFTPTLTPTDTTVITTATVVDDVLTTTTTTTAMTATTSFTTATASLPSVGTANDSSTYLPTETGDNTVEIVLAVLFGLTAALCIAMALVIFHQQRSITDKREQIFMMYENLKQPQYLRV